MKESAREDGASVVEYSIMVFLIAAVVIGVVQVLGVDVRGLFESVPPF